MHQNISLKKVRLNVQIPFELKDKLAWAADVEGKKLSVLVRESLENRLEHIEKKVFEDKMKAAYLDLAEENRDITADFAYSDAENL
jgi:hypothetical protein